MKTMLLVLGSVAGVVAVLGVAMVAGMRKEVPLVLEAFFALDGAAVASVRAHVLRSAEGMAAFVERSREGVLVLEDVGDLRAYCYAVAGIVGEMLTDLFLLGRAPLAGIAPTLRERAGTFGEALQLVNILKDTATDVAEGRSFLPCSVERSEMFALARRDLGVARRLCRLPACREGHVANVVEEGGRAQVFRLIG